MENKVIAVDGPSISGKSTVSKLLAEKMGFYPLDSGAIYRTITYYGFEKYGEELPYKVELVVRYFMDHQHSIQLTWNNNQQIIYLEGKPVSDDIRSEKISQYVSSVAENAFLRQIVSKLMLRSADRYNLVADGRDIGSLVFPDAWIKFFLTAPLAVRAQRKAKQLGIKCPSNEFNQLLQKIDLRDQKDSSRQIAPLLKTEDAIEINSGNLSAAQVVEKMYDYIQKIHNNP